MSARVQAIGFARALLALVVARVQMKLRPERALARRPARSRGRNPQVLPWELALCVERAARRLPFTPTCLERALALERLLASAGFEGLLVIGVRAEHGALRAHAWLEYSGQTLIGAPISDGYVRLLALRADESPVAGASTGAGLSSVRSDRPEQLSAS
jgi:hypothetical protein